MPYNGSGTFTRVHSWATDKINGLFVTASRMDAEDDGIATGLTNCVTKDGQTTATQRVPFAAGISVSDGTVALPGISWVSDPNSGFYRIGADNIALALNGAKVADFLTTGMAVTGTLSITSTANGDLLTLTSTNAGAVQGPGILLDRNSASPAVADVIGIVQFQGRNSAGTSLTYGNVSVEIVDPVAGTEDSKLSLAVRVAGAYLSVIDVSSTVSISQPTTISASTASTSPTTGALVVTGGAGIGGAVRGGGAITSNSATAGFGYATGAGSTVTQLTSKATGVTLNTVCGAITMDGAALAAATTVSFTLTNSAIEAGDMLHVVHHGTGTLGSYTVAGRAAGAGTGTIYIRNITAGSLSEAIVLRYAVIKTVQA